MSDADPPMTPIPPTLLFDLDDTVLSYSAVIEGFWDELVGEFVPADVELSALRAALAESRAWYWRDAERSRRGRLDLVRARREIVGRAFDAIACERPEVVNALADAFTARREARIVPFVGAIETLHELRRRGSRLGLVTNGEQKFQRAKIARFALEPLFDVIVIEQEFGTGKPDPRVFEHALGSLNAMPEETWMVGDNLEADIRPARELGLHTVWVDHEKHGLPERPSGRPHRVVRAIREILHPSDPEASTTGDAAEQARLTPADR